MKKLYNAGAFLSWYILRDKPILLLYFAYYYDSANSYAEHPWPLPTNFCLPLKAESFTLCEGQILTWHLHFSLPLSQYQGNFPFKLKRDMMFSSIAHLSCLKSDILMWFAGFQSGRCSTALVQYTHSCGNESIPIFQPTMSQNMPGCSEILLWRCLWVTWWNGDLLLNQFPWSSFPTPCLLTLRSQTTFLPKETFTRNH